MNWIRILRVGGGERLGRVFPDCLRANPDGRAPMNQVKPDLARACCARASRRLLRATYREPDGTNSHRSADTALSRSEWNVEWKDKASAVAHATG